MKISNFQFPISNIFQKLLNPFIIIIFAVVLRLLPHPPNVAPIAAMALFGGAYLNKRYAIIVPLVAMFISDIFLGLHDTMIFVYGSFFLIGLIGLWLRTHKRFKFVIAASLFSSILFFIVTNFGVWMMGSIYPQTFVGLISCYTLAIPFFRNTVIGDLFYVGVFFGGYELVIRLLTSSRVGVLGK